MRDFIKGSLPALFAFVLALISLLWVSLSAAIATGAAFALWMLFAGVRLLRPQSAHAVPNNAKTRFWRAALVSSALTILAFVFVVAHLR
jgi:hypothetical protein